MKKKIIILISAICAFNLIRITCSATSQNQDIDILARAIESEACGESYAVQASVGASLVNRLKDPSYPSSLAAVISDAGIDISSAVPSSQAVRAATDAIGGFDPTSGALHYSSESAEDIPVLLGTDGWIFY